MSSFPQPFTSTISHWQATNRGPTSLYGHVNPSSLPSHADIVIIGGGTMGASLGYFLTRKGGAGEGKRIVLLEGKDVASGASGRNGGHIGPATHEALTKAISPIPYGSGLTVPEGLKIVQQERGNLDLIEKIVKEEGWEDEVDFWRGELCEVHEGAEYTAKEKISHLRWLAARKEYGYKGDGDTRWYEGEEARKISRMPKATSCLIRPAGSVHSARLCTAFMSSALSSPHSSFSLFTWTPVSSIKHSTSSSSAAKGAKKGWTVKTDKGGTIIADRVILCTNAHTSHLFNKGEALNEHVFPVYAQAGYITPTTSYAGKNRLEMTYNMAAGGWYAVQKSDGGIILGGGESEMVKQGVLGPNERVGMVDDSRVFPAWDKLINSYFPTHFSSWGPQAHGEGLMRSWSGILGYSKDMLPLVGEVPGEEDGLWVAVGFCGHGQSRIFSTARSLAYTLASPTKEWDESLLPLSFKVTKERLDRCRGERQTVGRPREVMRGVGLEEMREEDGEEIFHNQGSRNLGSGSGLEKKMQGLDLGLREKSGQETFSEKTELVPMPVPVRVGEKKKSSGGLLSCLVM